MVDEMTSLRVDYTLQFTDTRSVTAVSFLVLCFQIGAVSIEVRCCDALK